jgi:hypothetical protein
MMSTDRRPYTVVESRVAADRAVMTLVVPGHGLGAGMAHHPNIPMRYTQVHAANAQDAAAVASRREHPAHPIQARFGYEKGRDRRSARAWAAMFLLRLQARAGVGAALGELDDAAYADAIRKRPR